MLHIYVFVYQAARLPSQNHIKCKTLAYFRIKLNNEKDDLLGMVVRQTLSKDGHRNLRRY